MRQESSFSRYHLLLTILFCYLVPVLGLSIYGALVPREIGDWNILSLGFLFTACGSLVLFLLMIRREASVNLSLDSVFPQQCAGIEVESDTSRQEVDYEEYELVKRSLDEAQQTQIHLLNEIDLLTGEMQKLSLMNKEVVLQSEKVQVELEQTKRTTRQQLELQQNHIRELQEVVADQKAFSEKKQQQMLHLETKVGDLTDEIKTLLQSTDDQNESLPVERSEPSFSDKYSLTAKKDAFSQSSLTIQSSADSIQEASRQLELCLDIAQKIKGSQRFGSQIYSFLDSPADSFSLDLRRLCDRLRSEAQSIILLYSPKDNHLLFASNQIKLLTGWSPEKFAQNFSEMLVDESDWKYGVSSLAMSSEVQIKFQLRTRSSQNIAVQANLGMIPTGIFRNHIIAVLYP